jgi:quinohemoprotein ethanol dehydrogenase
MSSSMLNRWPLLAMLFTLLVARVSVVPGDPLVRGDTLNAAASIDRESGQWPIAGRDEAGSYHSPLSDINTSNVTKLGYAWQYKLGTHRGLEATPVMLEGVLYTSGNFGRVYALDAASGRERWVYDPGVDGQYGRYACCDAVNRGVAVSKGRVYVAALDGYLHAIDAVTGKRVWKVDSLPVRSSKAPYTVTGAPVIAGNLVLIGAGGGDFRGARGYVAAFDVETGKLQWRFYTVPRNPAEGAQDQPHLVKAVETWDARHRWEEGGGGPVWDGISYDPSSKLIYIGTGNAAPYDIKEDGRGGGDNLYTACIIALHETGQLAWFYQVVPGDMWDFDSTQKMVLADLTVNEKPRKVVMQASKNGFYYVLDRITGELISAKPFAFANWAQGIDPKSGRPIANSTVDYANGPKLIFPWEGGAHSWQPMSFDPHTQRAFIPVMEAGDVQLETSHLPAGLVEGQFTSPIFAAEDYDPKSLASLYGRLPPLENLDRGLPSAKGRAFLRAWDPVKQRLIWEVATEAYWDGGVLSTEGGLVIQGDITGRLNVYAANSGKLLKRTELGGSVMAAPMTYRVGGIQYIAVMAGYGGGQIGAPLPGNSAAYRYGNEGRIIALKVGGGPVPLPAKVLWQPLAQPPAREGTRAQIDAGEVLYNRFCSRCHVLGPGVLPDLRRLTPAKHQLFYDIVLKGMLAPLGMGRFDDVLTHADAEAIHAYVVDQAWAGITDRGAK